MLVALKQIVFFILFCYQTQPNSIVRKELGSLLATLLCVVVGVDTARLRIHLHHCGLAPGMSNRVDPVHH